MRKNLIPLVLLAACSSPNSPTAPTVNTARPSFSFDLTQPAAPANVSAAVVELLDSRRASVRLTWTDNTTFGDEFNTCANAVAQDGSSAGGGCVYAVDYDQPNGSTGVRSGTIIIGSNAVSVSVRTNRRFMSEDGLWFNVAGPSTTASIAPMQVVIRGKKKG
jgi:hypothetical protein